MISKDGCSWACCEPGPLLRKISTAFRGYHVSAAPRWAQQATLLKSEGIIAASSAALFLALGFYRWPDRFAPGRILTRRGQFPGKEMAAVGCNPLVERLKLWQSHPDDQRFASPQEERLTPVADGILQRGVQGCPTQDAGQVIQPVTKRVLNSSFRPTIPCSTDSTLQDVVMRRKIMLINKAQEANLARFADLLAPVPSQK